MRRKFITLIRIIRNGIVNFTRNVSLAVAAMAIIVVTLTIVLALVDANATFNNTIAQINSKINVSVYLNDGVSVDQAQSFITKLQKLPNVKSTQYVSKDEALAEYKAENASNPTLLQAISETNNPLPASIVITPFNINKVQDIKNFLSEPANIQLQDPQLGTSYAGDRKKAIDKIAESTKVLKEIGAISVIVFAVVSALIIFNTLRMAIFNRRDEITIMRLLGASTWYIRGPFVVESMVYGVVAALISVFLIRGIFSVSSSTLQASSLGLLDIGYASNYFSRHFWLLLTTQIMLGILLGAVSSIIATRRYLKFKVQT